jgi:hypothetical protein
MTDLNAEALAYRARALAQAHPLTDLARHYLDWAVAGQRTSQPIPEIGIWAGSALLEGYCVRRVEEEDLGLEVGGVAAGETSVAAPERVTLEELDAAAALIAADLRSGTNEAGLATPIHQDPESEERLILALDRIVGKQVANRLEHWRDSVDEEAWRELEEYLTWWVVKGYALRVAESDLGAVRR